MSRSPGHPTEVAPDADAPEDRLTAFAARKNRFLAVVSHELRTPLTTIASFTESLSGDELTEAERPLAVEAVRRNTDRMLALVEDLMLLSRLETGDLPLVGVPVEVPSLVRDAVDALAAAEPATGVTVHAEPGPPVRGDAALLREVVYTAAGAVTGHAADHRARLTATAAAGWWTVTVVGTQAEPLTEEQLLASTLAMSRPADRRRSLALWMLLADAIADRHGGRLTVGYDPAKGASVTVRLPVLTGSSAG